MRQLLILRHAKSSHKDESLADYDRPLARRGRRDSPRIGEWLAQQGLTPDYVVSSPAKRARQTARKVCKGIGFDRKQINWDERVFDADSKTLIKVLADVPEEAGTVLLVGHSLGLESLILYLSDWADIPDESKLLPTAAVAWFKTEKKWNKLGKGAAQLVSITRPRNLSGSDS